jgi:hypothetical protein
MDAPSAIAGWLKGLGERTRAASRWLPFAGAFAAVIALVWMDGWTVLPPAWVLTVWVGAGLALLAASAISATQLWRAAERDDARRPDGLRLTAALVAGIGAALSMAEFSQAPRAAAVAEATESLRDYRFAYDAETRTLRVRGAIGPGFARTLKAALARQPVERIEIASGGGLVQEALRAGKTIERRKLVVVARDRCASACIVLLMSGRERWAAYDMPLEFHALSPVAQTWTPAAWRERRRAEAFLRRRGVPDALLTESNRIGPDYMLPAASIDLVGSGLLTGLVDEDGHPMPYAEAERLLSISPRPARLDR